MKNEHQLKANDLLVPEELAEVAGEVLDVVDGFWEALKRGEPTTPTEWLLQFPDMPETAREDLELIQVYCLANRCIAQDSSMPEHCEPVPEPDDSLGPVLQRGARLGQYEILERLGAGGMGEVYRARHPRLNREVAVKVLPRHLSEFPGFKERFDKERDNLARLSDPEHVVRITDAGVDNGIPYLVMEYIKGGTLQELVVERGPLGPMRACRYVRQAAKGVAELHRCDICHRDLKPANLVLGWQGKVKVIDLGLARALDDVGGVEGTWGYMPREQILNPHPADPRSDLFSLGGVFFCLLTGQAPFRARTKQERLDAPNPPPVRKLRPEIPKPIEEVVTKLLAEEPQDRFSTAQELIAVLDHILRRRWYRLMASLGAAAIVILVVGLVAFTWVWKEWVQRPSSGPGQPQVLPVVVPESAPLAVERMTLDFFFPERKPDPEIGWELVRNGMDLALPEIPTLVPNDQFRLEGRFNRPTHWFVLWFDTNGKMTVAGHSNGEEQRIAYPPDTYVGVNAKDPKGVHVLVLVAGNAPANNETLEARLGKIGAYAGKLPVRWAVRDRGPDFSKKKDSDFPDQYIERIRASLPSPLEIKFDWFFQTKE